MGAVVHTQFSSHVPDDADSPEVFFVLLQLLDLQLPDVLLAS